MRYPIRLSYALGPLFRLLGIHHHTAFVEVGDRLRVCLGPWFDEKFDLQDLKAAGPSTFPWFGGLGVKLGPGAGVVSVVGAREGVVALRFKDTQRVHVLLAVDCRELRLSLEDPVAFLWDLQSRLPALRA